MFETFKALKKVVKIQARKTELSKKQNALSKLEKINRKNEGKIQEQIVSLEKEIESLTGTTRPTRKQGVKVEEQTEKIIYSVDESTTEKIDSKTQKAEWKNVMKHLDNKITFDFNASGNLNATSGKIDEAVEIIESMNPKPKCVKISTVPFGERKGLKTLFVNINSKYNGIPTNRKHTEALLKKIGFEAVMP